LTPTTSFIRVFPRPLPATGVTGDEPADGFRLGRRSESLISFLKSTI